MTSPRRPTHRILLAAVPALGAIAAAGVVASGGLGGSDPGVEIPTAPVRRASLDATIVEDGEVDSARRR